MAMLRFRTARLAVEAEQADAEADWTTARFSLPAGYVPAPSGDGQG